MADPPHLRMRKLGNKPPGFALFLFLTACGPCHWPSPPRTPRAGAHKCGPGRSASQSTEHRGDRGAQECTSTTCSPCFSARVERKACRMVVQSTPASPSQRDVQGKGIFQVKEPTRGKFSCQKVLEPRPSDPKLHAFAIIPCYYSSPRQEVG